MDTTDKVTAPKLAIHKLADILGNVRAVSHAMAVRTLAITDLTSVSR